MWEEGPPGQLRRQLSRGCLQGQALKEEQVEIFSSFWERRWWQFLIDGQREIQHYWDETGHLLPNNPEGNLWIGEEQKYESSTSSSPPDIDSGRKTHKKWVTNVRDVNDAKTSYHVVVDRADHDDDQELPQRTLPLTKEGEERMKPEWTVEPKVSVEQVVLIEDTH